MSSDHLPRRGGDADRDEGASHVGLADRAVRDALGAEARFELVELVGARGEGDGARVLGEVARGGLAPQRGALASRVDRLGDRLAERQALVEDDVVVEGPEGCRRCGTSCELVALDGSW